MATSNPVTVPKGPGRWGLAQLFRGLVDLVTFRNMPVRTKFTLFTAGVSLWYWVIAAVGLARQTDWLGVAWIVGALLVAHALLIAFAVTAARSFTVPIQQINRQIREITSGELTYLSHIRVSARDEVGELTSRFNGLLDALRELQTFRKVIEQDDTMQDVFDRMDRVLRDKGLNDFQFLVRDPRGRGLVPVRPDGPPPRWCAPSLGESGLLCRAFKTAGPVSSDVYPEICPAFGDGGCDHYCLPLILGGKAEGVVQIVLPRESDEGQAELRGRLDVVRRFIHEALPVLEARKLTETLRESAMRDGLTRLYNRRFLEEMSPQITALVRRRQGALGLVMCDIDHFKQVNDTLGHSVGDEVLRQVAARLADAARVSDFAIRYGGEEFLLLLHDTDGAGAVVAAERLRAAVAAMEIDRGDGRVRVTMSFGVACFPADGEVLSDVLKLADAALYRAKEEGRNRVVRHVTDVTRKVVA